MSVRRPAAPVIALLALLAVALAAPLPAGASGPGRDGAARVRAGVPARRAAPPAGDALIVRYRAGAGASQRAAVRAAERLTRVRSLPGRALEVVRPRSGSLQAALARLAAHPDVESVEIDHHRVIAADPTAEPYWSLQWGHHNTGQAILGQAGVADVDVDGREALAITAGSASVVVAVIDDGVDFGHPDLVGAAWVNPGESGLDDAAVDRATNGIDDDGNGYIDDVHGWDFCHGDNTVHDLDDDWHGTAVAGAIAAGLDGVGVVGVAPATRIMALKFIGGDPGCSTDSLAIEAIAYAASFGVRIINASWGGPQASGALEDAIEASGALFVTAAGNGGGDGVGDDLDVTPDYPSSFPASNILSVAAIEHRGLLASFSNFGRATVDLAAPGESIALPCPADSAYPADWCWMDGTSFAAPYVAGVAALVGAVQPSLLASPNGLRGRLLATAVPLASTAGRTASGGLVNALRAIDTAGPAAGGQPVALPLAGSTLGASSVVARLAWPAATDPSGVTAYRVEQRRNGGAWTLLAAATSTRTIDVQAPIGTALEVRVRARDGVGNWGPFGPVALVAPVRYEDGTSLARTAGTWRSLIVSSASGRRVRSTTASGASMTFTFSGRSAAVIGPRLPAGGSLRVYLDGALVRTVGLYASTTRHRHLLYVTPALAAGRHTIRLVNTRYHGRSRADVDAFVVLR